MELIRPIGIGVVGVGRMGKLYASLACDLPESHLAGVTDLVQSTAEDVARELKTTPYPDCEALLQAPGLDAVVIATPDYDHVAPSVAAAQAGKHLFVEKPLAGTEEDCRIIIDAAKRAGVWLMVAHVLRFDPHLEEMKRAVEGDEIGDVVHVYTRRSTSVSDAMKQKGRTTITHYLGVHDIDMLNWVVGSPIVATFSRGARKMMKQFGVDDTVMSLLRFRNGAIGVVENFWIRPDGPISPSIGSVFEIVGTKGMMQTVFSTPQLTAVTPKGGRLENRWYSTARGSNYGIYRDEFAHFLACIRADHEPAITGEDGLKAVIVANAIEESLATGQEVEIG